MTGDVRMSRFGVLGGVAVLFQGSGRGSSVVVPISYGKWTLGRRFRDRLLPVTILHGLWFGRVVHASDAKRAR